jgi:hypothetical protein
MNDPDRLQHPPLTADTNLTPERSRSLIEWQRQEASSELSVDPAPFLISWGVVWLVGFGSFYFATAPHHFVPLWAASVVMGGLSAAAVLWMVSDLVRRGRGVAGPSRSLSVRYAWSWPIALGGILVLDAGLAYQGLPPALAPLLWPASSMVVAGSLYLAGGVAFADKAHYGIGVWALAVGAASVFAGSPGNFAVLALAGGGGLLATAALILLGRRDRSGEARL